MAISITLTLVPEIIGLPPHIFGLMEMYGCLDGFIACVRCIDIFILYIAVLKSVYFNVQEFQTIVPPP